MDSQDRELFSNVERRISMFNNLSYVFVYLNRLEPKAIYTFERRGRITFCRFATSRLGMAALIIATKSWYARRFPTWAR